LNGASAAFVLLEDGHCVMRELVHNRDLNLFVFLNELQKWGLERKNFRKGEPLRGSVVSLLSSHGFHD
jgi:hypothetical protein